MKNINENSTNITNISSFGFNSVYAGFKIYEDGKILYTTNRTYLECNILSDDKKSIEKSYYNNKIKSFNIQDPKKAIKLNLNRSDNFYIKEKISDYQDKANVLYIHSSDININSLGDLIAMKQEHETNYIDVYEIDFKYGYTIEKMHSKIVDKDYKLKDKEELFITKNTEGGSIYKIVSREVVEKNKAIISGDYYTKKIETDFRIKNNEIAKKFNEILSYKDFSHYDIEKLLTIFNIDYK